MTINLVASHQQFTGAKYMSNIICIYEDQNYKNLLPLVYFRPVYDLKCGVSTLREKIEKQYKKAEVILNCRKYLENSLTEKFPDRRVNQFDGEKILFINGRILVDGPLRKVMTIDGDDALFITDNEVVGARLSGDNIRVLANAEDEFLQFAQFKKLPKIEVTVKVIGYPWDLVNNNGEMITEDIKWMRKPTRPVKTRGVHCLKQSKIYLERNVEIKPNVVLDAEKGPIYISEGVTIYPNVYIQGPVFIGANSVIKANAAIYHDTTIGEMCKVGGEIENSIIHSYSNKQHEGFLGHAYLGSWINIGASTNNSDLKNNYGNITVLLNGEKVDTGSQFVGLMMGDHSKTAINTMFNTGTVVGAACNVFGAGFPKRYLPSFAFGGCDLMRTNTLKQALEVAEIVMQRRKIKMSDVQKELFEKVFELTSDERKKFLK